MHLAVARAVDAAAVTRATVRHQEGAILIFGVDSSVPGVVHCAEARKAARAKVCIAGVVLGRQLSSVEAEGPGQHLGQIHRIDVPLLHHPPRKVAPPEWPWRARLVCNRHQPRHAATTAATAACTGVARGKRCRPLTHQCTDPLVPMADVVIGGFEPSAQQVISLELSAQLLCHGCIVCGTLLCPAVRLLLGKQPGAGGGGCRLRRCELPRGT